MSAWAIVAIVAGSAWGLGLFCGGFNYLMEGGSKKARRILAGIVLVPLYLPTVWLPVFLRWALTQGLPRWLRDMRRAWLGERKQPRGQLPDKGPYRTNGEEEP